MSKSNKPCGSCGEGTLKKVDLRGEVLMWRDFKALPIIDPFEVERCNHCGDFALSAKETKRFDELMESSLRQLVKLFTDQIMNERECRQKDVAAVLGVSPQHLANCSVGGNKLMSFGLFNFLRTLAKDSDAWDQAKREEILSRSEIRKFAHSH